MDLSNGQELGCEAGAIQISFKYGEHYMHLVEQPKAAAQLFQLLPGALAYGAGLDAKDIVMYSVP